MTFEEIKALDERYVMQTYGRNQLAIDRGSGATVYDTAGKEYIDFTSGIGVCSLGYANEAWAKAIYDQAMKLGHISNLFYTEPYAKLASKLVPASGMAAVFFGNSGAEANEGMIKLARKYSFEKYGKGRATVITLRNSFHGRTITTLKATGLDVFHNYFFPFTEGFRYVGANDLSALEDAGFIQQPHTSAGRVPTDAGYRTFVDELLLSGLAEEERPHRDMVEELRSSASELDALMERTSAALARLTNCLSVVMAPSVFAGRIHQITLVSLSDWQAIVIVVAEDGQVVNRTITFTEEVSADELAGAQNLLNRVLVGQSARDVRRSLDANTVEALSDPLVQLIIDEVIDCLGESDGNRAHSLGISSLLRQPEFSDAKALLPVMEVLEDDRVLLHTFDETAQEGGPVMVRIGHENPASELAGVSIVACPDGRGEADGIVAVIGPTRMNYASAIRAVRAAQCVLHDE